MKFSARGSVIFFPLLLAATAFAGGIWNNAVSDVDADGYPDLISYNVGETGEYTTICTYAPTGLLHTPRLTDYGSCMGIGNLEEVIQFQGITILASGRPVMVGGKLQYDSTLFDTKTTSRIGQTVTTTWVKDSLILTRVLDLTAERALVRYSLQNDTDQVGLCAIAVVWNNGSVQGSTYCDQHWQAVKAQYTDSFPNSGQLNGFTLTITHLFDDYLQRQAADYLWGWDKWGTSAYWGIGYLSTPDSLTVTGSGACNEWATIIWKFRSTNMGVSQGPGASVVPASRLQSYPNPFCNVATIAFTLPSRQQVQVVVYNAAGQKVRVLFDREGQPGRYDIPWDGRDQQGRALAAGQYIYRVSGDGLDRTGKLVLIR